MFSCRLTSCGHLSLSCILNDKLYLQGFKTMPQKWTLNNLGRNWEGLTVTFCSSLPTELVHSLNSSSVWSISLMATRWLSTLKLLHCFF